jgi:proteasome component ECM29
MLLVISKSIFIKEPENCEDKVEYLLGLLLNKYTRSPNPHIRQAACIWLVALVQQCGTHPAVNCKLMQAQSAFMAMLGENDGKFSL